LKKFKPVEWEKKESLLWRRNLANFDLFGERSISFFGFVSSIYQISSRASFKKIQDKPATSVQSDDLDE